MSLRDFAAVLGAALLVVACDPTVQPSISPTPRLTAAPTPTATPLVHGRYYDDMISFDYPLEWNDGQFWHPSSVSLLKLMASTEELRAPCVQSGGAVLCRNAVVELSPGGLFVSWWRWGLHHAEPGPDPNVGELIHVGGRSARISDAGGQGKCLNMKADVSLRLEIPDPTLNGSWTVMDACLREPIADARAALDEMLQSIKWLAPQPSQTVPFLFGNSNYSVRVFDDTGLLTNAAAGLGDDVDEPTAIASGSDVEISWYSHGCDLDPIVGLSQDAGHVLILLEPDADRDSFGLCQDVLMPIRVVLHLSEPVAQDDLYLEVW